MSGCSGEALYWTPDARISTALGDSCIDDTSCFPSPETLFTNPDRRLLSSSKGEDVELPLELSSAGWPKRFVGGRFLVRFSFPSQPPLPPPTPPSEEVLILASKYFELFTRVRRRRLPGHWDDPSSCLHHRIHTTVHTHSSAPRWGRASAKEWVLRWGCRHRPIALWTVEARTMYKVRPCIPYHIIYPVRYFTIGTRFPPSNGSHVSFPGGEGLGHNRVVNSTKRGRRWKAIRPIPSWRVSLCACGRSTRLDLPIYIVQLRRDATYLDGDKRRRRARAIRSLKHAIRSVAARHRACAFSRSDQTHCVPRSHIGAVQPPRF